MRRSYLDPAATIPRPALEDVNRKSMMVCLHDVREKIGAFVLRTSVVAISHLVRLSIRRRHLPFAQPRASPKITRAAGSVLRPPSYARTSAGVNS